MFVVVNAVGTTAPPQTGMKPPVAIMHLLEVLPYLFIMLFLNLHRMPGSHSR
jgi:hypothetical protein